jgi:uroporphyrinogen III methyltransferase / synthase
MEKGKVYLLGAGPGDPGLLTIRAKEILERADVVVYDYLASETLLGYCRPDAEIVYVGKKGGDHTLPQGEINALLVRRCGEGKSVARLKGGDPYVFGRGAEEAEELVHAGLEFEVVPGVTSAVAATSLCRHPPDPPQLRLVGLLHHGARGPDQGGQRPRLGLPGQRDQHPGLFHGGQEPALDHGPSDRGGHGPCPPRGPGPMGHDLPPADPGGGCGVHRCKGPGAGLQAASLLVVGEVVKLRGTLSWFEKRPLLGKGVVVTRAREQASDLVRRLEELGACCFEFPTIRIVPLEDFGPVLEEIDRLGEYGWVVFTSVNGVKHFFAGLKQRHRDARALAGCRVAALGPATALELEGRGIRPDFVPEQYVAERVVEGLLRLGVKGERVLIPRARVAREVLPEVLSRAGAEVTVLPVYETRLAESGAEDVLEQIRLGGVNLITFTSSSTVENFFQLVSPDDVRPFLGKTLSFACIGPVTAKTLQQHGFETDLMPQEYTIPGWSISWRNAAAEPGGSRPCRCP